MLDKREHPLHLAHFFLTSPLFPCLCPKFSLRSSVASCPSLSPACLFDKEYTTVAQWREIHNSS